MDNPYMSGAVNLANAIWGDPRTKAAINQMQFDRQNAADAMQLRREQMMSDRNSAAAAMNLRQQQAGFENTLTQERAAAERAAAAKAAAQTAQITSASQALQRLPSVITRATTPVELIYPEHTRQYKAQERQADLASTLAQAGGGDADVLARSLGQVFSMPLSQGDENQRRSAMILRNQGAALDKNWAGTAEAAQGIQERDALSAMNLGQLKADADLRMNQLDNQTKMDLGMLDQVFGNGASGGNKVLSQDEVNRIAALYQAEQDLTALEKMYSNQDPDFGGPVFGRVRSWAQLGQDPNVAEMENAINAATPNLARGVFREVGTLTDADAKRYQSLFPQPTDKAAVRERKFNFIKQRIQQGKEGQMDTLAKAGRNVSGFAGGQPPRDAQTKRFNNEAEARNAGMQSGDIIEVYDPSTATYRRARLN